MKNVSYFMGKNKWTSWPTQYMYLCVCVCILFYAILPQVYDAIFFFSNSKGKKVRISYVECLKCRPGVSLIQTLAF